MYKIAAIIGFFGFFGACTNNKIEPVIDKKVSTPVCDTTNITYSAKISPIFTTSCFGCHDQSDQNFAMQPFSVLKNNITSKKSVFLASINHASGASKMPKNGNKLADCDIKAISKWIEEGMLQN